MKTKCLYICDFCGKTYETSDEAFLCEATCLGLTLEEYKKYKALLVMEQDAYKMVSLTSNEETNKRCDEITKVVIAFEKEHGLTGKNI